MASTISDVQAARDTIAFFDEHAPIRLGEVKVRLEQIKEAIENLTPGEGTFDASPAQIANLKANYEARHKKLQEAAALFGVTVE